MQREYKSKIDPYSTKVTELYAQGYGCPDIVHILEIAVTPRSVQRYLKKRGLIRDTREAVKLAEPKKQEAIARRWEGYIKTSEYKSPINPTTRYKVMERDNFSCVKCGANVVSGAVLEVDHKVAVLNGGTNDPDNLQTLCNRCNIGKFWNDDILLDK